MHQAVSIRKPLPSEIPEIAAIGRRLFIETFDGVYRDADLVEFLDQVHSVDGVTTDWNAGCQYWIAETDQVAPELRATQWIGYCKAGPVSVPVDLQERRSIELRQLYIDRLFHRFGIGSKFMAEFFKLCVIREIQDAYVSCWSENAKGLAFYNRFGFEVVGQYEFIVGQQRDAELILCKRL